MRIESKRVMWMTYRMSQLWAWAQGHWTSDLSWKDHLCSLRDCLCFYHGSCPISCWCTEESRDPSRDSAISLQHLQVISQWNKHYILSQSKFWSLSIISSFTSLFSVMVGKKDKYLLRYIVSLYPVYISLPIQSHFILIMIFLCSYYFPPYKC